jgi:anti-sigma B factor antagonist
MTIKQQGEKKAMDIAQKEARGVVTLTLQGKLSAATAEAFDKAVASALPKATKRLVIDFKDVSYLASAGIRVLVKSQKKLAAGKIEMVLRNVKSQVKEIFEMAGLDAAFTFK